MVYDSFDDISNVLLYCEFERFGYLIIYFLLKMKMFLKNLCINILDVSLNK